MDEFNRAQASKRRGIAITPVKFGISFTATLYNQAGAMVLVYRDGSVQVSHGGTEMGQGLYTKIRQIAATALGTPLGGGTADADAHGQGSEHFGDGGFLRLRPQWRGGDGRLLESASHAGASGRPECSVVPRRKWKFADGTVVRNEW